MFVFQLWFTGMHKSVYFKQCQIYFLLWVAVKICKRKPLWVAYIVWKGFFTLAPTPALPSCAQRTSRQQHPIWVGRTVTGTVCGHPPHAVILWALDKYYFDFDCPRDPLLETEIKGRLCLPPQRQVEAERNAASFREAHGKLPKSNQTHKVSRCISLFW